MMLSRLTLGRLMIFVAACAMWFSLWRVRPFAAYLVLWMAASVFIYRGSCVGLQRFPLVARNLAATMLIGSALMIVGGWVIGSGPLLSWGIGWTILTLAVDATRRWTWGSRPPCSRAGCCFRPA